jgi:preprotein translocase subunit SecG
MVFIIGLLTLVMVLDCALLILLVLIQLPKKDAGAGLAFGGAATDALFGAGSGTVLTKVTKYAAVTFFVLAIGLSILQSRHHYGTTTQFERQLAQPARPPVEAVTPVPAPAAPPASSKLLMSTPATAEATNIPAPAATNLGK